MLALGSAALLSMLAADPATTPVLVELFTSEGCSSCPRADEALDALSREQPVKGVRIVPLAMHVTYWNHLGWADPFSKEEFTARQQGYGDAYTPQMVVAGTHAFVGNRTDAVEALSLEHQEARPTLELKATVKGDTVELEASTEAHGELFIALTESGLSTQVERGENAGRTLKLAPLARHFAAVKSGERVTLTLLPEWKRDHLTAVAFVQAPHQGRVLNVATAALR
jgi:hypothetical protein